MARAPAPAERAVDRDLTGVRTQTLQHFRNHDRDVHTRRRFPRREDLLHVLGVFLD
jgi:hypothetical protein